MPWRFSLTALLFTVVNLSLAWQQWLIGRAMHDVERGIAVIRLRDGALDYSVARYWLLVLLAVAFSRGILQYFAGLLSLINHAALVGQGGLYASLYRAYEENAIGLSASAAPTACWQPLQRNRAQAASDSLPRLTCPIPHCCSNTPGPNGLLPPSTSARPWK
jgi:hypothetical protein